MKSSRRKQRRPPTPELDSDSDDDDVLDIDTLKQFTIPKRKKIKRDLLESLSENGREFQNDILPMIRQSYRDRESSKYYQYSRPRLVHNDTLMDEYVEKKHQMKSDGYTEKELVDTFCFLHLTLEHEVKKICENGLRTGNTKLNSLGDPTLGVYLSRHADIISAEPFTKGRTGLLIVFKVIKGRIKFTVVNEGESCIEPTPNYDCHMVKTSNINTAQMTSSSLFNCVQVYAYEYTLDADLAERPKQIIPFAVISYRYQGMPSHEASRLALPVAPQLSRVKESKHGKGSSHMRSKMSTAAAGALLEPTGRQMSGEQPEIPEETPDKSDLLDEETILWSGVVKVEKNYMESVELVGHFSALVDLPACGSSLSISQWVTLDDLKSFYLRRNVKFDVSSSCRQHLDWYQAYMRLRPAVSKPECFSRFKNLTQHLNDSQMAAFVEILNGGIHMLLVPVCKASVKLGLTTTIDTESGASRPFLHCVLISRVSCSAQLQDASRFRKLELVRHLSTVEKKSNEPAISTSDNVETDANKRLDVKEQDKQSNKETVKQVEGETQEEIVSSSSLASSAEAKSEAGEKSGSDAGATVAASVPDSRDPRLRRARPVVAQLVDEEDSEKDKSERGIDRTLLAQTFRVLSDDQDRCNVETARMMMLKRRGITPSSSVVPATAGSTTSSGVAAARSTAATKSNSSVTNPVPPSNQSSFSSYQQSGGKSADSSADGSGVVKKKGLLPTPEKLAEVKSSISQLDKSMPNIVKPDVKPPAETFNTSSKVGERISGGQNGCGTVGPPSSAPPVNLVRPRIDPRLDPRLNPRPDPRLTPRIDPRLDTRSDPRLDSRPDPRLDPRLDPRPDSRLDPRPDPRLDPRPDPRLDPRPDPRLDPRLDPRPDPRIDPRIDPRLSRKDITVQEGTSGKLASVDNQDVKDSSIETASSSAPPKLMELSIQPVGPVTGSRVVPMDSNIVNPTSGSTSGHPEDPTSVSSADNVVNPLGSSTNTSVPGSKSALAPELRDKLQRALNIGNRIPSFNESSKARAEQGSRLTDEAKTEQVSRAEDIQRAKVSVDSSVKPGDPRNRPGVVSVNRDPRLELSSSNQLSAGVVESTPAQTGQSGQAIVTLADGIETDTKTLIDRVSKLVAEKDQSIQKIISDFSLRSSSFLSAVTTIAGGSVVSGTTEQNVVGGEALVRRAPSPLSPVASHAESSLSKNDGRGIPPQQLSADRGDGRAADRYTTGKPEEEARRTGSHSVRDDVRERRERWRERSPNRGSRDRDTRDRRTESERWRDRSPKRGSRERDARENVRDRRGVESERYRDYSPNRGSRDRATRDDHSSRQHHPARHGSTDSHTARHGSSDATNHSRSVDDRYPRTSTYDTEGSRNSRRTEVVYDYGHGQNDQSPAQGESAGLGRVPSPMMDVRGPNQAGTRQVRDISDPRSVLERSPSPMCDPRVENAGERQSVKPSVQMGREPSPMFDPRRLEGREGSGASAGRTSGGVDQGRPEYRSQNTAGSSATSGAGDRQVSLSRDPRQLASNRDPRISHQYSAASMEPSSMQTDRNQAESERVGVPSVLQDPRMGQSNNSRPTDPRLNRDNSATNRDLSARSAGSTDPGSARDGSYASGSYSGMPDPNRDVRDPRMSNRPMGDVQGYSQSSGMHAGRIDPNRPHILQQMNMPAGFNNGPPYLGPPNMPYRMPSSPESYRPYLDSGGYRGFNDGPPRSMGPQTRFLGPMEGPQFRPRDPRSLGRGNYR